MGEFEAHAFLVAARLSRLLLLPLLMVVVEVALEQGTLNGCLVRRLAQLGEVRLARREALELVSLRALLAAHTLVAVQAAGRQLEVAKLLEWSQRP